MIGIIAAVTMNGIIGVGDQLPFDYPEDLKHFKSNTLNSTIIMGRRTFEGIGRPLPKRTNIVITSRSLKIPGIMASPLLSAAISSATTENVWLIGGASIYEEGLNYADKILLTITPDVENRTPAVKFPWINPLKFNIQSVNILADGLLQVVTYLRIR